MNNGETARDAALAGLLVVDFSHYIAGPVASMILGDLGATVVKVENARRGDDMRHFPPADERLGGEGAPFLWANRNKRSIALDLKTERGRAIARGLIAVADVALVIDRPNRSVRCALGSVGPTVLRAPAKVATAPLADRALVGRSGGGRKAELHLRLGGSRGNARHAGCQHR